MAITEKEHLKVITEGVNPDEEKLLVKNPKVLASTIIAISWSLFQLAVGSFLLIDSTWTRAIHLAFGIMLVYLNTSFLTSKTHSALQLLRKNTWIDVCLGIVAVFASLYIVFDYTGLASRSGSPLDRDVLVGFVLIVVLLEATRRTIGPALPVIVVVFILYSFLGPMMPSVLAFKGISLSRFMSQITMDTEGIFGVPLQVSASIVFLFVLFGTMLDKAGGGEYFIKLAVALLGTFRGGAAKAAVAGSALTGMVSGSSIANVVTTGTFTIPLMKRLGYPAHKAAGIEVAASVNSQLAPPVMGAAAFIIAEYVNIPYIEVAKAAAIPAFSAYIALLWIVHVEACKLGLKGLPRSELPPIKATFLSGLHFLIPLAMLIYELTVSGHSPEKSIIRAILVLAIIMLIDKPIRAYFRNENIFKAFLSGIRVLILSLSAGAKNMCGVAMATAAAGIIVGIVSLGLGQQITSIVDAISGGNVFILIFITALAGLILGMGLPTTANYIIMASLTAPIMVQAGASVTLFGSPLIVPLLACHLFCFYFGILADDTPPVGLAAYAGAAIADASPIKTGIQAFTYDIRTAVLPFVFFFNHDLILWNISSIPVALMIFSMTALGSMTFASITQNFFLIKNNVLEIVLLLITTLLLMFPALLTMNIGIAYEYRHLGYFAGLFMLAIVVMTQLYRKRKYHIVV